MRCLCGSGKFVQNCHKTDGMDASKIRRLLKYDVYRQNRGDLAIINATFIPLNFGKNKYHCVLKFMKAVTPAGEIICPLLLQKNDKSIRPITIDGMHFIQDGTEIIQSIHCMLTPVSRGSIVFKNSETSGYSNGIFEVPCQIECEGNPFNSAFTIDTDGTGKIKLYHHTDSTKADLIHNSLQLRGSKWNLQGTEELHHQHHIYFTQLQAIDDIFDLMEIGMADAGTSVKLVTDDGSVTEEFPIYREEAGNRDATLAVWIKPELIAPPPLILHRANTAYSSGQFSWWEIFCSSIFRVPIKINTHLPLKHISGREYHLEQTDDYVQSHGFLAGCGMDMISMKRLLSEISATDLPRIGGPTRADLGEVDPQWVDIWSENLSAVARDLFLSAAQASETNRPTIGTTGP